MHKKKIIKVLVKSFLQTKHYKSLITKKQPERIKSGKGSSVTENELVILNLKSHSKTGDESNPIKTRSQTFQTFKACLSLSATRPSVPKDTKSF